MKTPEQIEIAKFVLNGMVAGVFSSGKSADDFAEQAEKRNQSVPEAFVKLSFVIADEFIKQSKK
jgi:hypothetical protein